MEFTRADLTNTTEAVKLLLAELDLNEYRFTFEPRDVGSQVRVEYAATDGWRSTTLPVDEAALLASREDRAARRVLSGEWRERLIHAKRRTGTTDES